MQSPGVLPTGHRTQKGKNGFGVKGTDLGVKEKNSAEGR